mmetsp:Transcript_1228/g.2687  ORF Transcript_1228/g.2687 Transcript_1228/m.2687 type:complete len:327 (-) Transcript_1228:271-1251(-)|eukprot:CAMPEP_0113513786 /NCGR_PEP_ID=MMETSP0014_2-20120614/40054_1 /TAXON_ID=2857 /ORGANISM="Nitzschia sp." /LENGTH=326 /DNA_ID=CAMNT_0000410225 /DNA_START=405 /DNA_END=1385 /DNA_ORIENTATION=- /assembly_acc=CAM_ASM_000159
MKVATTILAIALASSSTTNAFVPSAVKTTAFTSSSSIKSTLSVDTFDLPAIEDEISYKAGQADTEFAKRFGGLAGAEVKTVGESFAQFTEELGFTVNALYKNMVTDLVGTMHLIVVNARFTRDPVWSLGILTTLDLLLKNYPEPGMQEKITSALFKSTGLDEATIRAEAKSIEEWAQGKTKEEVEAALASADESSPLGKIAAGIKKDEFWMYSRYFGIGLVKIMDIVGIEMDKDEVYPVMENWLSTQLGRSHLTACSDSDLFFRVKDKLDMMETMMKEIEIREKKRMAERLEEKAEVALRAAEREGKLQAEIEAEAKANRERVGAE